MSPIIMLYRAIFAMGLAGCLVDASASSIFSLKSFNGGAGSIYMTKSGEEMQLGDFVIRNIAFNSDATFVVPHSKMEVIHSDNCIDFTMSSTNYGNSSGCFINFPDRGSDISISTNRARTGQIEGLFKSSGEMVIAFDMSAKSPASNTSSHVPIYAVTGKLPVPPACNEGSGNKSGKSILPEFIEGTIGDTDNNGFIDGKLVAIGVYTPDAAIREQECFVLTRNFSTDIPYENYLVGKLPNGGSGIHSSSPITVLPTVEIIR